MANNDGIVVHQCACKGIRTCLVCEKSKPSYTVEKVSFTPSHTVYGRPIRNSVAGNGCPMKIQMGISRSHHSIYNIHNEVAPLQHPDKFVGVTWLFLFYLRQL